MSVAGRPPLHPEEDKLQVETWELPRWDAEGELTESSKPKKVTPTEEDIEADTVTLPTAEEIRAMHEDAYNEGFESGYEQGLRQGQQDGQKQGYDEGYRSGEEAGRQAGDVAGREAAIAQEEQRIETALKPLGLLLQGLNGCITEQRDALESGLIALALRIARQVIDAELTLAPEHINNLVHSAVQALPNADERITIELHPEDLSLVERVAETNWTLSANDTLSRGGCLVKTRFSYIDYSLEHRYRQQVSNLLAHHGLSEHLQVLEQPWGLPEARVEQGESTEKSESDSGLAVESEAVKPRQADTTEGMQSENTSDATEPTRGTEPASQFETEQQPAEHVAPKKAVDDDQPG